MCLETERQGSVGIYQQLPPVLEALGWDLKKITGEIKTEPNPNRDMRRHRDNTMCTQYPTVNSKERDFNTAAERYEQFVLTSEYSLPESRSRKLRPKILEFRQLRGLRKGAELCLR